MSRAYLNCVGNPDSSRRHNRRERFMNQFDRLPIGAFDLPLLAKKTRVPFRTALAYAQQLHFEGRVKHQCSKPCRCGFQFYIAVWSRIK